MPYALHADVRQTTSINQNAWGRLYSKMDKIVAVEWTDAEFHSVEIDAKNIATSIPTSTKNISRSIGTLIYADEIKLVLAGTKHTGGNETYRDLLVIPQGMVVRVYELQVTKQLFGEAPKDEQAPPQPTTVEVPAEIEARLKEACGEHVEKKRFGGFSLSRKDAQN